MASKKEKYSHNRELLSQAAQNGHITRSEYDAIIAFLDAKDPDILSTVDPEGDTKAVGTLASYSGHLRRFAVGTQFDITDCTPEQINLECGDMITGQADWVKEDGLSPGTVSNLQSALRKFYEYHDDLGIEKNTIAISKYDPDGITERDIFTQSDIDALRKAAGHKRDRALIDLLLYTGQRVSAIRFLRVKDIDLEDNSFYLNEDAGDLKGASGKRPLLYAEKSVREWYHAHPTGRDEDAFLTQKYEGTDHEVGTFLTHATIYKLINSIAERAGVDKPSNPHNFRHTWVTIAKRDYGMDSSTIEHILGHAPGSSIWKTTYSHLSDDDVARKAEQALGIRDENEEENGSVSVCQQCGEPVTDPSIGECSSCGLGLGESSRWERMDQRLRALEAEEND